MTATARPQLQPGGAATARTHRPARLASLAIASGKGGVGKTWLAISLAQALARQQERVLLFDGDLGLANVDVQLGLTPRYDLAGVIAGTVPLTMPEMA